METGHVTVYQYNLVVSLPDGIAIRREKRHENALIVFPNNECLNKVRVHYFVNERRKIGHIANAKNCCFEIPNTGYIEIIGLNEKVLSPEQIANSNLKEMLEKLRLESLAA